MGSIQNQTFTILGELRVLDLSKNDLKQLRGDEFHGLAVLRELNLQNNQVKINCHSTIPTFFFDNILFLLKSWFCIFLTESNIFYSSFPIIET